MSVTHGVPLGLPGSSRDTLVKGSVEGAGVTVEHWVSCRICLGDPGVLTLMEFLMVLYTEMLLF